MKHTAGFSAFLLQGEDLTDHFLRILTDLAVTHCLTGETSSLTARPGLLYFIAVDAYVRLLIMLITGKSSTPIPCCSAAPIQCSFSSSNTWYILCGSCSLSS